MPAIIKSNQFNISNISFSDVKNSKLPNGSSRKQVWINHNNGKFIVQTPAMFTPFGLNEN